MANPNSCVLPIRAVIFDYGDVISLPADPAVIAWMTAQFHLTEEGFRQVYAAFRHEYDRGNLDAAGYWGNIGRAAGVELSGDEIAQLRQADVAMWSRLNEAILRWASLLRAEGLKTGVLSNMHADMVDYLRANGEWTRIFNCVTLSSVVHLAKPEPDIFNVCLRDLGVRPEEALFIDDRERNVAAAQALGIWGVAAPSPAQLRANLQAFGFCPLPSL